jgi:hypothetical protein
VVGGLGRKHLERVRDGGRVGLRVLSRVRQTKLPSDTTHECLELVIEGGMGVVEDEVVRVTTPGVLIGDIHLLSEEESLTARQIILESVEGLRAISCRDEMHHPVISCITNERDVTPSLSHDLTEDISVNIC